MYDELVKRLRAQAVYLPEKFSKNAELLDVLMKAADAIEELQKRVPKTPHGRLIDADALSSHCKEMQGVEWNNKAAPYSWAYAYESFEDDIDNAPTIIPAEEGE